MFTCTPPEREARFHALPAPTDAEVARVTTQIGQRVHRLLVREGLAPDPDAPAEAATNQEQSSPVRKSGLWGRQRSGVVNLSSP